MTSQTKTQSLELLSAQKLLGYKVANLQGKGLGRMEDIMFSAEEGRVAYAVVSFGGVLGLGNKLVAFPWTALRVDHPKKRVFIDLDRKTLETAHRVDKDHWPDTSSWDQDTGLFPTSSSPAIAPVPALPGEFLATASETPAGKRIDHWGQSWESHGLDRR